MTFVSIKLKLIHPAWTGKNRKEKNWAVFQDADPNFLHKYRNFTDEIYGDIVYKDYFPKTVIVGDMDNITDELHITVKLKRHKESVIKYLERLIESHFMTQYLVMTVEDIPSD